MKKLTYERPTIECNVVESETTLLVGSPVFYGTIYKKVEIQEQAGFDENPFKIDSWED